MSALGEAARNGAFLLALLILLSACSSSGDSGSSESSDDQTAPTVSSVSPGNLATGVARDSDFIATFSEDIFSRTIGRRTVTVTDGDASVTGTVSFDPTTNEVRFSPDTALSMLTTYTVTLSTDITDVAGNALASSHAWSFTTADGVWGVPSLVDPNNTGNAILPNIVVDPNGNALVVWNQDYLGSTTPDNIQANQYIPGSGWGIATLIETDNTGRALDPDVGVDASGNGWAVWSQSDGTQFYLYANRYTSGAGWGEPTPIEESDSDDPLSARIAVNASGDALVLWRKPESGQASVFANRYTPDSGWESAVLLETNNNNGGVLGLRIGIDSGGNGLAVWSQFDGIKNNVYFNRYTADSGWGEAGLVTTDNTSSASNPSMAIDDDGNALVVWQQSDGVRTNIHASHYASGSGWGDAMLLESDNAGDASNSQVAFDGNGSAVAVWHQSDGIRTNIVANRYTPGSGWGDTTLLETNNAGDARNPQVALDSGGNALILWRQNDGSRDDIYANRYTPGNGWETATLIETDNSYNADIPHVAIDGTGKALAVWSQSNGFRVRIYSNVFE